MDRAYADARRHGWSREPIIELVIPSTARRLRWRRRRARGEPVLPACGADLPEARVGPSIATQVAD
jgi:hypothetical protein